MLKIAKAYTAFSGIITLIIGFIFLGITIWAYMNASLTFNQKQFLNFILISDLVIILSSLLGIYGVKKQIGILIFIFQILIGIFCLTFLTVGIVSIVGPRQLFSQQCGSQDNDSILNYAYVAYGDSKTTLCFTCPCNLRNDTIQQNYGQLQKVYLKALNRDQNNGAKNFQQCYQSQDMNDDIDIIFPVLQAIQQSFKCSGWCNNDFTNMTNLFYKFSNVNNGRPQSTCYDTMKQKLNQYGQVVATFSFVSSGILFIGILLSLYICCSKKKASYAQIYLVNNNGNYVRANY